MTFLLFSILAVLQLQLRRSAAASLVPQAKTINGTFQGLYSVAWNQDHFLGIPYAQSPVGDLRYRWPQSINTSFPEVRNASSYGCSCMQYTQNFIQSEDCLTLNVIRPSSDNASNSLPVLVWIHGGGLFSGSTADPRYNLSGIVKISQEMGQPIIAVSMNYRLGMWGFLQTPQLLAEGSSNAGLLDQRLALHWIQENIAAFGGDPRRVVVWGESAGAQSIAYHMFGYDGRDDGLFRAAIMESGGPTGAQIQELPYYVAPFENLTRSNGCWSASNQLACLRGLSHEDLYSHEPSQLWNPLIDGDFLTAYPSQLIREHKYNAVPLLIGANSDEGTSFSVSGADDEKELFQQLLTWRSYTLSPPTIRRLLELYPDDPCIEPPFYITNCSRFPSKGLQWRRAAAIGGDMVIIAGRRKMCELYTAAGQPVYSYRFDTRLYGSKELAGVRHFDNTAFSFQNITGLLGSSPEYDVHARLARGVGEAYVRFVNDLNPSGGEILPEWPMYSLTRPTNMVLNASRPYVEEDTWRKDGIAYLNSYEVSRELLA